MPTTCTEYPLVPDASEQELGTWSLLLPGAHGDATHRNLQKATADSAPLNPIETLGEETRLSCPERLGSCQAGPLGVGASVPCQKGQGSLWGPPSGSEMPQDLAALHAML